MTSISILKDRLHEVFASRTPFSFLRLGDGEGAILDFDGHPTEQDMSYFRSHFGPNITVEQLAQIKARLEETISSSDIVGIRKDVLEASENLLDLSPLAPTFLDEMKEKFPLRKREKNILQLHSAKRIFNLFEFYRRQLQQHRVINQWAHYELQVEGFWDAWLASLDEVCLITSKTVLKDKLEARFNLSCDLISVSGKFAEAKPERLQLDADFDAVVERLQCTAKGRVHIVAAGIVGKYYCHVIKQAGGIALDLGALVDFWAGVPSRGLIGAEYGGVENNHYFPPTTLRLPTLPRKAVPAPWLGEKKILLHVGVSKAGGRSFQHLLAKNEEQLRSNGVNYVRASRQGVNAANHNALALAFGFGGREPQSRDVRAELCEEVLNEVRDDQNRCHVLSADVFSHSFPNPAVEDEFITFINNLDAKIIVSVQNQLDWTIRWHQDLLRQRLFNGSIEQLFRDFRRTQQQLSYNYFAKIKYLESVVGRDRLLVVTHDRAGSSFAGDLAREMGLSDGDLTFAFEFERSDRPASEQALCLAVALGRKIPGMEPDRFNQTMQDLLAEANRIELPPCISIAFPNALYKVAREANKALSEGYGVDLDIGYRQAARARKFSNDSKFEENVSRMARLL